MSIPDAQQKFAMVSLIFRLETFIKLRNIIQSFNIIVYNSGKGYLFVYILFYSVHVKQAFGITEKKEVHSKSYFNIECKLCKSINTTIVLIFSRISVYYWLFKNDHLERTEEHAIWSILVVIIWSLLRESEERYVVMILVKGITNTAIVYVLIAYTSLSSWCHLISIIKFPAKLGVAWMRYVRRIYAHRFNKCKQISLVIII